MEKPKSIVDRLRSGLILIKGSMVRGTLIGSAAALLLPSVISFRPLLTQKLRTFPTTKLARWFEPWSKAVVAPDRLGLIVLVAVLALVYLGRESLRRFLQRCYAWSIYEPTLLWGTCSFLVLTRSFSWGLLTFIVAVAVTCVIAWHRAPRTDKVESLISSDLPIERLSQDKLNRHWLIVSLVSRLLDDAAQVIAVIGAYGDGKTSILNLLDEDLQKQNVVVVRFKSSLPGDDLTLASTLFNSIGKQLHRRFFIQRLDRILRRFARQVSGLVPSVPKGLKDIFAEPAQQDELSELTARLDNLPIRRVVVLLDDMDRMQASELRMLLKIIRAADNYPKLSFVCAFNKKALVDGLVRHQVTDRIAMKFSTGKPFPIQGGLFGAVSADDTRAGYEYLEKFFPVQIPVPKLDDAQLSKEFDLRFNEFAQRQGLSMAAEETAAFDKEFSPFWKTVFRPKLNNLRKMNSYFNALNSSFVLVKREVNVIDFMFVELLRQIDPEMYEQVFKNRSLFYYPSWDLQRWDEKPVFFSRDDQKEEEYLRSSYDEIFRHLHGEDREYILRLLSRVFPKVAKYRKPDSSWAGAGEPNEAEADKQKRVFHPEYFMIYFTLHVEEGYLGTSEFEDLIENVNQKQDAAEVQEFFCNYVKSLQALKRHRFFEKMSRFSERLRPMQAKALVRAVSLESDKLKPDELDIGEFRTATVLVLALANRFGDSREITKILQDVIGRSATDGFAYRIFQLATDQKEENKVFEKWDNVDPSELTAAILQRLGTKYQRGGKESIYSPGTTWRDWQALVWWGRDGDQRREDVRNYLQGEFEKRPSSIGKHIFWLWNSLGNSDGKRIVDELFPLSQLAELARKHGSSAYSTSAEKSVVEELIQKYGRVG